MRAKPLQPSPQESPRLWRRPERSVPISAAMLAAAEVPTTRYPDEAVRLSLRAAIMSRSRLAAIAPLVN